MNTTYKEYPALKMVEIRVQGYVTDQEFDKFAAKLRQFIKTHGQVRLLEIFRNLDQVRWSIFFKGVSFDIEHISGFSHCALATDSRWIRIVYWIMAPFLKVKIKTFSLDEIDAARLWLEETN